jgi:hypothetical protein
MKWLGNLDSGRKKKPLIYKKKLLFENIYVTIYNLGHRSTIQNIGYYLKEGYYLRIYRCTIWNIRVLFKI